MLRGPLPPQVRVKFYFILDKLYFCRDLDSKRRLQTFDMVVEVESDELMLSCYRVIVNETYVRTG